MNHLRLSSIRDKKIKKEDVNKVLVFLLILGALLRFIPAYIFYGTGDVHTAQSVGETFLRGENVYNVPSHSYYNYYPTILLLIVASSLIEKTFHLPYHFLEKTPSIIADIAIIFLLYKISDSLYKSKYEGIKAAFLYTFNPISIIISGFHGQYDSLVILCVLFTFYIFSKNSWNNVSKKILLLSIIGILLKIWSAIAIPLIAVRLKNAREAILFLVKTGCILIFVTLPFVYIFGLQFLDKIYFYMPPPDYGFGAIFEHFPSFFKTFPSSVIKQVFSADNLLFSKILLVILSLLVIVKGRKMTIFNASVLLFTVIYSASSGLGSQYLLWIVPFGILAKDKIIIPYSFVASLAIISFYLDRYKSAFTATTLQSFFTIGHLPVSYGKMIVILWIFSLLWFLKKMREV